MKQFETTPLILVVDDCPEDVELLRKRLSEAGVTNRVAAFGDAGTAIAFLQRTALRSDRSIPGLIFVDVNMPGVDGVEFLKWLRKQPALRRVAVTLVSGAENPGDAERAYQAGADHFLLKHPVADVLANIVASAIERRGAD